ncbi:hypothetical protein EW146_g75 [Bondarzewia mesenterica]|uniref:Phospholipid/glycerol acyltransferase domain-containing protein n=1 Tax=Bondarzewia mesenterica TaxID=1095465 RepID=A0A4S4M9L3_9AGAM|nr:hypothetical protein EW146_g75 [Bondarzewia mesenterica]
MTPSDLHDASRHSFNAVTTADDSEKLSEVYDIHKPVPHGTADVFEDNEDHQIQYKTLSWQFVSLLMISEIVSNGMLSLPNAVAVVGLVPSILLTVFLGIFALFTAKLLIDFKSNHPDVHNMGDAGFLIFGPVGGEILSLGTIIFAICAIGSELLSGQQALSTLSNQGLCTIFLVLIFSVATFLLALPRTLDRLSWIGLFSAAIITLAGVVAMIGAGINPTSARIVVATVPTNFYQAFLAITGPVFAYAGHFMFFILISEMRRPQDAMKAAWVLQVFATVFYAVFSVVIYVYLGSTVESPALLSLPPIWSKVTFGIALANFLFAGALYSHTAAKLVFIRFFRHSRHVYSHTFLGWFVWISLCFAVVAVAFILAIAVPIFSYLIGIAAALFASWYTYGLAGFFWLYDIYHLEGGARALKRRWIGTALAVATILAGAFICVAGTYVSIKLTPTVMPIIFIVHDQAYIWVVYASRHKFAYLRTDFLKVRKEWWPLGGRGNLGNSMLGVESGEHILITPALLCKSTPQGSYTRYQTLHTFNAARAHSLHFSMSTGLFARKISDRPPKNWAQTLNAIAYAVVFNFGCLMINASQFAFLLPLRLLPFEWAGRWYDAGIRYSKGAFGALLILMCQWFAPTRLVVTFERDDPGAFAEDEIAGLVVKDKSGKVIGLNLPHRSVLIANHQVYADWWYAWCLTYFSGTHRDVFIVLKKSLKWVPIVGWGMQFFNFIFLARSWASDRLYLVKKLAFLGHHAEQSDTPLTFILYPEGTLVSSDTKPISKKYAEKIGVHDMMHTLLPRSTGLQYSLRTLSPRIPSLQLIDVTVAYPGIPPLGYGQDYYTLRSIFFDRIPPPSIHMHIRRFDIAKEVPIGDVSKSDPNSIPNGSAQSSALEIDVPEDEKQAFDAWLRQRWVDKDRFMQRFLDTGSFSPSPNPLPPVVIPLELRHRREILDAFCFFIPAIAGWIWSKHRNFIA